MLSISEVKSFLGSSPPSLESVNLARTIHAVNKANDRSQKSGFFEKNPYFAISINAYKKGGDNPTHPEGGGDPMITDVDWDIIIAGIPSPFSWVGHDQAQWDIFCGMISSVMVESLTK